MRSYDFPSPPAPPPTIISIAEFLYFQEIIEVDKKKRSLNDRETDLRQDKDNLIKIVDLEENHLKTLEKALELVSSLTDPQEELTLDRAAEVS